MTITFYLQLVNMLRGFYRVLSVEQAGAGGAAADEAEDLHLEEFNRTKS